MVQSDDAEILLDSAAELNELDAILRESAAVELEMFPDCSVIRKENVGIQTTELESFSDCVAILQENAEIL